MVSHYPSAVHQAPHGLSLPKTGVVPFDDRAGRLEHFPFRWIRNGALGFCFDAFSSRGPVSTSLENALDQHARETLAWPFCLKFACLPLTFSCPR
jgi:hypothetical protein